MRVYYRKLIAFASTTVVLTSLACAYDTDEIYFKEIPLVDYDVTFALENYEGEDTILLSAPEILKYHVDIEPGVIDRVELLLDDDVLLTTKGGHISYPFGNDLLKEGVYKLSIRFTATPARGSLAEKVNEEKLFMVRTWILKIEL